MDTRYLLVYIKMEKTKLDVFSIWIANLPPPILEWEKINEIELCVHAWEEFLS